VEVFVVFFMIIYKEIMTVLVECF